MIIFTPLNTRIPSPPHCLVLLNAPHNGLDRTFNILSRRSTECKQDQRFEIGSFSATDMSETAFLLHHIFSIKLLKFIQVVRARLNACKPRKRAHGAQKTALGVRILGQKLQEIKRFFTIVVKVLHKHVTRSNCPVSLLVYQTLQV